jgi:hypothetical protein
MWCYRFSAAGERYLVTRHRSFVGVRFGSSPGIDRISGLYPGSITVSGVLSAKKRPVIRRRVNLRGDSHRRFHPHRCRHGIVITIPANGQKRSR